VYADFDNDGLSNYLERQLGTNIWKADTDDDTLSDNYELEIGTNPLKADTDNDAIPDNKELEFNTNPLIANELVGYAYQKGIVNKTWVEVCKNLEKDGVSPEEKAYVDVLYEAKNLLSLEPPALKPQPLISPQPPAKNLFSLEPVQRKFKLIAEDNQISFEEVEVLRTIHSSYHTFTNKYKKTRKLKNI